MESFIKFYKYIVVAYYFIIAGTILVSGVYEKLYDVYPSQFFYLKNCDYSYFKEQYIQLYKSNSKDSLDFFIFHEPYKGRPMVIKYMEKEGLYSNSLDKKQPNNNENYCRSVSCSYYIPSVDGYVAFKVVDGKQVKIILFHYTPSFSKYDKDRWKKEYTINGREVPYKENKEIIRAFENEVLNKIALYEKDDLQGYLRQYISFSEKNLPYYVFHIFKMKLKKILIIILLLMNLLIVRKFLI